MTNILVIAEHDHATLKAATLNTVTAAQEHRRRDPHAGGGKRLRRRGHGQRQDPWDRQSAAGWTPTTTLITFAEDLAVLIAGLANKDYSHVLAPATSFGKNLMPRVAALLGVTQLSDIVGVENADTFVRPIYAGSLLATVQCSAPIKAMTVRVYRLSRRPPARAVPHRSKRCRRRCLWA